MKESIYFSIILLVTICSATYGQDTPSITKYENKEIQPKEKPNCTLQLNEAPTLRGLRLGMSIEDVKDYLGISIEPLVFNTEVSAKNKNVRVDVGDRIFTVYKTNNSNFDGIKQFTLRFFEDELYQITIIYSIDYIKWENEKEFANSLSEKLNLPQATWRGRFLSCESFELEIRAESEYSSVIILKNLIIVKKINELANKKVMQEIADEEKKQKQMEDDKKKAFKP